MSWHKAFARKHAGNPLLLIVAAVGFTLGTFGMYRYGYKPWARRKMLSESEEYANYLFKNEMEK